MWSIGFFTDKLKGKRKISAKALLNPLFYIYLEDRSGDYEVYINDWDIQIEGFICE